MSVFDSNLCCFRSNGRTVKHIISNYKTKKEESENNNYSSSMTNQNIVNMQIQSLSMLQVIEPMCCMCSKINTYIPKFNYLLHTYHNHDLTNRFKYLHFFIEKTRPTLYSKRK